MTRFRSETVSSYLSRGGTVTRCAPGAFGWPGGEPRTSASRRRGGAASARASADGAAVGQGPALGKRIRAVRMRRATSLEQVGRELDRTCEWVRMMEAGRIRLADNRADSRRTVAAVELWLKEWE